MVLSGNAIKRALDENVMRITPFSETHIEAAHVNLHLGEAIDMDSDGILVIEAGKFLVARTAERVTFPVEGNLCGILEGRSKLAQQGISIEQSSTFIEPGSDNTMALEIYNASKETVRLERGQKVAKMIVMRVTDDF